jgi:hypothetical protein
MGEVKLARAPVPEGDPRSWLVQEVLKQGATALPCVLTAVRDGERLVALPEDPSAPAATRGSSDMGAVESALFKRFSAPWVGAWGTAVLDREGRPALVTFVRIREEDGQIFVAVWPRVPGQPPIAEMAEQYDGPLGKAPRWLRALFPPLVEAQVDFVDWEFQERDDTESEAEPLEVDEVASGGFPAPDFGERVPDGASFEDVLVIAAERLEARFVRGDTGPALVAWHEGGISAWFASDDSAAGALKMLGSRIAGDARILGLGLFGLGEDEGVDPPARLIALAMESRDGERIVWIRRFRMGSGSMATWMDDSGFVRRPGPRIGWFERPEG